MPRKVKEVYVSVAKTQSINYNSVKLELGLLVDVSDEEVDTEDFEDVYLEIKDQINEVINNTIADEAQELAGK